MNLSARPSPPPTTARAPFHLMTKPIGSRCNLDCSYCFYLEKEKLYTDAGGMRMKPEVLETYVRDYITAQPGPAVSFAWQGGEPTLLGVGFFRPASPAATTCAPATGNSSRTSNRR